MPDEYRKPRNSVVFPLLLIAIGLLFLLLRWMPDFEPWGVIWKYWPLLLILVGAGMIWDRSQRSKDPQHVPAFPVGTTIGTIFFLLILALLVWHHHGLERHDWLHVSAGSGHLLHENRVVQLGDAKAVRMNVTLPAGELQIEGGATQLMQADFARGGSWAAPAIDYMVENGVGTLSINQESAKQLVTNSDNIWKLKVNDKVPLELEVDIGAGRSDLNLANVNLTRLELNIGAGQANVDLTGERAKDLEAVIQGGVGEAVIRLPKSVGVVATVHGGLGSVDVHGLKEEDDQYTNAAYGKAPNTIHLTVEGGIGHIKLEQE